MMIIGLVRDSDSSQSHLQAYPEHACYDHCTIVVGQRVLRHIRPSHVDLITCYL